MEDEWDMIDSVNSSEMSKPRDHRPSLDFNRFHTMPEFTINDDDDIAMPVEENSVLCESPTTSEQLLDLDIRDQDFEFTLGDSKLMMNDTTAEGDDSNKENNEVINDNQNGESVRETIPFLSSLHKTHHSFSVAATRESLVDQNTVWKNSTSGSSVPYMSNLPYQNSEDEAKEQEASLAKKQRSMREALFPSSQFQFSSPPPSDLTDRFKKLQSDLSTSDDEQVRPSSSRPIKQTKRSIPKTRTPTLSLHQLPSFAASPSERATLTTQRPIVIDVQPQQPQQNEPREQSAQEIADNVSKCMLFADNEQDHLATFMYELETLTPIQQWSQLKKLNLSRQSLSDLTDLSSCFPMLEMLQVLLEVDIYHLDKLQHLDVSHNRINHFESMKELKSLRSLNANNNSITSCKSFQDLPGLVSLSLKANCIRRLVNFQNAHTHNQLESLDVSYNRIECLDSIESLVHLRELNADHNELKYIQLNQPIERLCKLQLSFNRLKSFDISPFPDIRVLYLDDNQIQRIIGVTCASRLDSFSLRDQGGHKIEFDLQYLRGTRKLYLSGSHYPNLNRMIDFYSLEYLEICAAELEVLPPEFGKQVPNLSTLYLSMNRLTDIRPLRKLKYLKRLVLIDNRLISINEIYGKLIWKTVDAADILLRGLAHLRHNPISSNIYPSLDANLIHRTSDHNRISPYVLTALDDQWAMNDAQFLETLSDHWKTRRQVYRALFMQNCPKLVELDHIEIDSNDRSEGDLVIVNFKRCQASSSSHHSSQYS
ncbi:L domain-like protein [Mucor ambiguus]|uniref:L domain-like protein n=1 Tax=Mucor ambiguus TaxID=91626 RepID=A0A0C9LSP3_9FUNG|nr:L domain-like protein [Mucor ambiguus]